VGECGLDLIQLSGDEPADDLAHFGGRAFKALRPRDRETAIQQSRQYARRNTPPALLLDGWKPGEYGGTGQPGSWSLARSIAREFPIFLAGGLNPENVTRAIDQVRPWGVDVASGVESEPGKKDPHKINAFLQAVRAADG
jgi:phosphoribosylanthranilate isomerase